MVDAQSSLHLDKANVDLSQICNVVYKIRIVARALPRVIYVYHMRPYQDEEDPLCVDQAIQAMETE